MTKRPVVSRPDSAIARSAVLDVGEVDFYTVSAQKWLCAPDPAGALYVRDPAGYLVELMAWAPGRG